jgi:ABC-type amino acid transport substrate-binding protein
MNPISSPSAAATAALLAALLLAGCAAPRSGSSASADPAARAEPLRVGIAPRMPPLVFKQNGEYAGLEVEFARSLGLELGRPIRFVECDWEDLIPRLMEGKIDIIMSGMSMTPERQVRIDFASPYLHSGQVALCRADNAANVQVSLLWGKLRVGFQKGTTGEYFVQRNLNQATKIAFNSPADGARSLARKKIDVFIDDAPVNWWLASENETSGLIVLNSLLTDEYLAWGLRKGDTQLATVANRFIEDAKKDGRLKAMVMKWTGGASPAAR